VSVKWRGPFPWLATAFVVDVAVTIAAGFGLASGPLTQEAFTAMVLVALAGAATLFTVSWKIIDFLVVRSVRRMAAEVRAIAYGADRPGVDVERYVMVSPLPEAVNEVCARMVKARAALVDGLGTATRKAEETSNRLAAILNDLDEGVLVCNQRHQLVLFNMVAFDMLRPTAELGLGRSLFETIAAEPVLHMYEGLRNRPGRAERGLPFLAGTLDDRLLLRAKMTLIRGESGGVSGYVVTLADAAPHLSVLIGAQSIARTLHDEVAAPLDRLTAQADEPALVRHESASIALALRRVEGETRRMMGGWWPMADINSTELLTFVRDRLGAAVTASVVGLPLWLHGESYSLVLAVETLVRRIAERVAPPSVDLAAGGDEDGAWIEIGWEEGGALESAFLDHALALPLRALGGLTVGDVLRLHAGADRHCWIGEDGRSLRQPLSRGIEQHGIERPTLPARPEFHDLDLLEQARDLGERGGQRLRDLTYVVFDTETTGLHPSQGDRIVSVAGVRIVNGRILSGEGFNRIVNPGRPIPAESVRFHGITDEMVKDKPPVEVVLPQFHAYIADAVLVAHNAAFDMKFLRMGESGTEISFDSPVLDTMILSNFLDGPEAGHSLDAICERNGIVITDRHTALGDAMVTAAVLLRQIEALEARGIVTLDDALKSLDIAHILFERQRVL
jgi:DNA polymerase-3 subunit epsilon